jgi:hypothetical protein
VTTETLGSLFLFAAIHLQTYQIIEPFDWKRTFDNFFSPSGKKRERAKSSLHAHICTYAHEHCFSLPSISIVYSSLFYEKNRKKLGDEKSMLSGNHSFRGGWPGLLEQRQLDVKLEGVGRGDAD